MYVCSQWVYGDQFSPPPLSIGDRTQVSRFGWPVPLPTEPPCCHSCFFAIESHVSQVPRLFSNSLCSWRWTWTSGASASTSRDLGLQGCTTTSGLFGAWDRIRIEVFKYGDTLPTDIHPWVLVDLFLKVGVREWSGDYNRKCYLSLGKGDGPRKSLFISSTELINNQTFFLLFLMSQISMRSSHTALTAKASEIHRGLGLEADI